jgi:hypothetical protein
MCWTWHAKFVRFSLLNSFVPFVSNCFIAVLCCFVSGVPTQSLINTLNFMQFFMDIKVDANIQKLLKRYQDNKAKYSRVCPQGDEVMRTLSKRLVDGDSALDSLIVQCTTLHSMDDFVRLTDVMSFPTMTDEDNRVTGEMAFNYAHLRKWIGHASDRQRQLFDSLLLKMRTLPQQMKMSPKLSETALLASLHILKQNLSAVPISDSNFAQSLIPALEQFLLWPKPYVCSISHFLVLCLLKCVCVNFQVRSRGSQAAERDQAGGVGTRSRHSRSHQGRLRIACVSIAARARYE